MIDVLIFCKNRSMQLDLFIESFRINFGFVKTINILYKYDNDFFKQGFDKLIGKHSEGIRWIPESNFERDTKAIINSFLNPYCVCFTDDEIVTNKIEENEFKKLLEIYRENERINCLSLRMNSKIDYCGSACKNVPIPKFIKQDEYLLWNWSKEDPLLEWGYPSCINSHVRKTNEFKKLINSIFFGNANHLEGEINKKRDMSKPLMMSFLETKVFNVANNYVKGSEDVAITSEFDTKNMNQKYLEGYVLDFNALKDININYCYGPAEYKFIKLLYRSNNCE